MSGLSPDPKMMREQQNKDAPETIEADETRGSKDRPDADPSSGKARREAQVHTIGDPANGQDDVLAANERVAGSSGEIRPNKAGPLSQKDRSRLGG